MPAPNITLYQSMLTTVREQRWVRPGISVLVACSGGMDSMLLLRILNEIPALKLGVAHLNHGLRGQSAAADAEFVQNHASGLGLPFYMELINVQADGRVRSQGLEAVARQKRYAFLESVRVRHGYDVVATGHTGSDLIETILLNIYRGTGVPGLRGIQAASDVLVRPLLAFTRDEIEKVAGALELEFRTDESNSDWRFTRNQIRAGWLAHQEPENQKKLLNTVRALCQSADVVGKRIKETSKYLEKQTVKAVKPGKILLDIPQGTGYFSVLWKALFDKAFQQVTRRETGISENHFLRLMAFMNAGQPGQYLQLPGGCRVYRDRRRLTFISRDIDSWEMSIFKSGERVTGPFFTLESGTIPTPATLVTSPRVQYTVSAAKSWKLRPWQAGDTIQPFGENGSRKVSDLLQAAKVAPHVKQWWPVLEIENEIVWIPGVKPGEKIRIKGRPTQVLKWEIALETGCFE